MRCDLHLHSDRSDGDHDVKDLVALVDRAGVRVFALTDHDTVEGLDLARQEAARRGLRSIDGIELSTQVQAVEIHLLGYGFDPQHPALQAFLASRRRARRERVEAMIAVLRQLGVPVTAEEVETCAEGSPPGRPHVAEALVRRGHVRTAEEAFTRFLASGKPAWVPGGAPDTRAAIATLHMAQGRAVWAHPLARAIQRSGGFDRLAGDLKASGLDGVELVHPAHTPESRRRIRRMARELRLLVTGGSDYHGRLTPGIEIGRGRGDDYVPSTWVDALLGQ